MHDGIQLFPGCSAVREGSLSSFYPVRHPSKPSFTDFLRSYDSNVTKEGSQRKGPKRASSIVILALRSFACKPIFRSALPCIFLFQHVCVGRIAGSEDFRLGQPSGQRITGVIETLLSLLLAPESLFLRRNRRKRISFPDWNPEERISL